MHLKQIIKNPIPNIYSIVEKQMRPILVKTTRDVPVTWNLRLAKRVRDQTSYDLISYVIMRFWNNLYLQHSELLTPHLVTPFYNFFKIEFLTEA